MGLCILSYFIDWTFYPPAIDLQCILRSFLRFFLLYPQNIPDTRSCNFHICILNSHASRRSSAYFFLSDIPRFHSRCTLAVFPTKDGWDLGKLLRRFSSLLAFVLSTYSGLSRYLASIDYRSPVFCILVRIHLQLYVVSAKLFLSFIRLPPLISFCIFQTRFQFIIGNFFFLHHLLSVPLE